MARDLALFDFDGTITHKDTFIEFLKFAKGNSAFIKGFILLSPILVLFKLKLIANWKAKELTIKYFFGGMAVNEFNVLCSEFNEEKMPNLIREKALVEIIKHQNLGNEVYVVSASAENWINGWCKANNIKIIATRLEVLNGKISGKISGKNCYTEEKENRIRAEINLDNYENIWAYGDSSGDKQMLALATKKYYKPFRD